MMNKINKLPDGMGESNRLLVEKLDEVISKVNELTERVSEHIDHESRHVAEQTEYEMPLFEGTRDMLESLTIRDIS